MRRQTTSSQPALAELSSDDLHLVSGSAINQGSHGVQTHVPGRLSPDESEQGTVAGTVLSGSAKVIGADL